MLIGESMADQTIKYNVNVDSNGTTDKEIKKAKALRAAYDDVNKAAGGGTAGSRNLANKAEGTSYGLARSAVGTGAGGRDFAKQAQGLGGLVHVYATFAANLFAVGAAFRALSQAADTSNMVKGLDQLSASSGMALGSLSKQLVAVTDGAISMREAMEATTKGGAAGLSSDQMLKLGEVAKKASQALGISMTDAISRLSRGISKLEPELLDELGLYTKLGKATDDYARSVGKTAASLTDYEKRQAFANAVLKEGSDKFASIKIDSNPYDKLLASMKNVGQSGLELVNKVLGPIAEYLAKSPTALMTVFAGIAGILLSRAIPAIGHFREGLVASAKDAEAAAQKFKASFGDVFQEKIEQRFKIPDLKNQITKAEKDLNSLKVPDKLAKVGSFSLLSEAAGTGDTVDKGVLKNVNDLLKTRKNLLKDVEDGTRTASQSTIDTAKREISVIEKTVDLYNKRLALATAHENIQSIADKKQGRFDPEVLALEKYVALRNKAAKAEAVSNAAQNAQILGIRGAWDLLNQEIEQKGITGVTKYTTKLSGGLAAVGSRLAGMANAFGMWGQIIGAGITAFSMLDGWLSSNTAELEKFKTAMGAVHDAGVLVDNVLKSISESGKGFLTVESILARANAFKELTSSISKGVQALQDVDIKAGTWDRFIDGFKTVIGTDIKSVFQREMSLSISKGIESITDPAIKKKLSAEISDVLGTSDLSYEGILAASEKISSDKIIPTFKQIDAAHKKANATIEESAKNLRTLGDDFTQLETSYQNVVTSLALSDPLSKFGSSLIKLGLDFSKAFQDPINAVAEFNKLLSDTSKLSLLPTSSIQELQALKTQLTDVTGTINSYQSEIEMAKKEIADIGTKGVASKGQIASDATRTAELNDKIANAEKGLADSMNKLREFTEKGSKIQADAIREGLKLLERSVTNAQKSADIAVQQTLLAGAEGPLAAKARGKLTQEELNIQLDNIKATINLTDSIISNRLALEKNNAILERDYLSLKAAKDQATPEEIIKLENVQKLIKDLDIVSGGVGKLGKMDLANLSPGAAAIVAQRQEMTVGARAQIAGISGKQRVAAINTELDVRQQALNILQKNLKLETDIVNLQKTREEILQGILPYLTDAQVATKNELEDTIANNNYIMKSNDMLKAEADLKYKISQASGEGKIALEESLRLLEDSNSKQRLALNIEESIRQIKQKIADIDNKAAERSLKRETAYASEEQKLRFTEASVTAAKDLLDVQSSLSLITDAEAEKRRNALEIQTQELAYDRQALKITDDRAAKLEQIQDRIDKAKAKDPTTDVSALEQQKRDTESFYTREQQLLELSNDSKRQAIALNQSMSDKMKGFSKIVEDSFISMGDALVQFAKTGKLNFKGLVNDMITELVRFELRAQMSLMYKSMGGLSGIMGMLGFGSGPNANITRVTGPSGNAAGAGSMQAAKGAYFDGASSNFYAFAKGGAFSNSIVSNPTLFKFAQGTGLMGEAGPEAIMPLKRDANGNLGVRAGQSAPETHVVVNNYSGTSATTKQTTDSRGNKKIEVIIGEMVATEMSRPNSPINSSMKTNFQVQPALVRR